MILGTVWGKCNHRMLLLAFLCVGLRANIGYATIDTLQPGEESAVVVPYMAQPPKIDGTLEPNEWRRRRGAERSRRYK